VLKISSVFKVKHLLKTLSVWHDSLNIIKLTNQYQKCYPNKCHSKRIGWSDRKTYFQWTHVGTYTEGPIKPAWFRITERVFEMDLERFWAIHGYGFLNLMRSNN